MGKIADAQREDYKRYVQNAKRYLRNIGWAIVIAIFFWVFAHALTWFTEAAGIAGGWDPGVGDNDQI